MLILGQAANYTWIQDWISPGDEPKFCMEHSSKLVWFW